MKALNNLSIAVRMYLTAMISIAGGVLAVLSITYMASMGASAWALAGLAVAVAGGVTLLMVKSIVASVSECIAPIQALAEGNLGMPVSSDAPGIAGQILSNIEIVRVKLNRTMDKDIGPVLDAALHGDLSGRVDTSNYLGFYKQLGDATNRLIAGSEQAIDDTIFGLECLQKGDIDQRITAEYEGKFDIIKQAINNTAQKLQDALNKEIQPVLDAALRGDLAGRVDVSKYEGFYKQLGDATNRLIAGSEQAIDDTIFGLECLQKGDIDQRITAEYEGKFDIIKQAVNNTAQKLQDALNKEIQPALDAARHGDLSMRVDVSKYEGFYKQLDDATNELIAGSEQAINDTVSALKALEDGDLTHKISNSYDGLFDTIKQTSNNTAAKLAEVVRGIADSAGEVGNGSAEIAKGNAQLNDSTQQQAASLEETAAAIEEITGTIKQTADNSRQANQLATEAQQQAKNGSGVVDKATEAMSGINASSKKIADIIGVIDEIAFQTNLLALNAAVEAARAGDQGRGFAVVAGEVRSLAQRSAEAAKEIKGLINDSVSSVDEGSKLVDESGKALKSIVNSVQKVNEIVAEIAAASQEQAAGVEQINKAIAQLDSGTQQNAAMVEEVNAASENLDEQVQNMNELISVFNLGNNPVSSFGASGRSSRKVVQPNRQTASQGLKKAAKVTERVISKASSKAEAMVKDESWEEF